MLPSKILQEPITATLTSNGNYMWFAAETWGVKPTEQEALAEAQRRTTEYAVKRCLTLEAELAYCQAKIAAMTPLLAQPYVEPCPCCGEAKPDVERRRMNTSYVEDDKNFETCCLVCHEEHEHHWDEQWADYYGSWLWDTHS